MIRIVKFCESNFCPFEISAKFLSPKGAVGSPQSAVGSRQYSDGSIQLAIGSGQAMCVGKILWKLVAGS